MIDQLINHMAQYGA